MKEMSPYFFQGFFILCMGGLWAFSPKEPKLAVVDMKSLISTGSQSLAKSGRISTQEVQEWGDRLKEGLEDYAQGRQLVLLAKGAVVGGSLPDVTEEVMELFERKEKSNGNNE